MENILIGCSAEQFKESIANNLSDLKDRWDCYENSFVESGEKGKEFVDAMNANLRTNELKEGITGERFCEVLNNGFNSDVRRFQDIIKEKVVDGANRVEPTAIISDNGNRLDLFGTQFYTYSIDGVNFEPSCNIWFEQIGTSYSTIMCLNFFRHEGKVYCTSVGQENGNPVGILLWEEKDGTKWGDTSTDKYFTNPKVIYPYVSGDVSNFGNTFVFYEKGYWYLLMEAAGGLYSGVGYQIYLCKSSTFDGIYAKAQEEPVIKELGKDGVGNPELAMVGDIPYKCDGKYYMYYHYHNTSKGRAIYRAYSYDLISWTIEGPMLDVRIPPYREWTKVDKDGDLIGWSNGDQCLCEFKGHTYLFYTNNANQYLDNDPLPDVEKGEDMHIDMCVDFRPWSEILRLRP